MDLEVPSQSTRRWWQVTPPARAMSRLIGPLLLSCLFNVGCWMWSNDTARIKIIFTDADRSHRVENVSAIVGADKFFWGKIDAGEVETVTLKPGPSEDWQLTLFYTLNGAQKIWESPRFAVGKGYRIEIKIDPQGAVTHRHCFLPCNLD
jgi:hypothetical protein